MHADELRIALLHTWRNRGLDWPVYGVLDADELARYGIATLAIEGGGWCEVKADDVRVLSEISIDDVVAAVWIGKESG